MSNDPVFSPIFVPYFISCFASWLWNLVVGWCIGFPLSFRVMLNLFSKIIRTRSIIHPESKVILLHQNLEAYQHE
ncbi:MAG: hypothetical protein P8X91_00340 [Candidatus Bathyarchaeota archaeon]